MSERDGLKSQIEAKSEQVEQICRDAEKKHADLIAAHEADKSALLRSHEADKSALTKKHEAELQNQASSTAQAEQSELIEQLE